MKNRDAATLLVTWFGNRTKRLCTRLSRRLRTEMRGHPLLDRGVPFSRGATEKARSERQVRSGRHWCRERHNQQ